MLEAEPGTGRWARLYDRCVKEDCTTPDEPHAAHGLCRICLARAYRKKKPEDPRVVRERVRRYRARKKSTLAAKRQLRDKEKLQADKKWRKDHGIKDRRPQNGVTRPEGEPEP